MPGPSDLSVLDGSTPTIPQLTTGTTIGPKSNKQISLERDTLDFGSNLAQRWLEIDFDGDPTLIYVINSEPWVDSHIERGRALDDAIRLIIDIDRSQLTIGEHSTILTVGAAGAGSVELALHLMSLGSSGPIGALSVSRQTLDFADDATALSTVLANNADRPLSYSVQTSVAWAQPSITDGSIGDEKQTIQVTVSRQGLYPRTYFGWIEIRADNGQIGVINLIMTVPDDPAPDSPPDLPDPEPSDPPDPDNPPDPAELLIIPWVELNTSSSSAMDVVVEGLLAWQRITDTAIVSTVPGKESLYGILRERVPGMRIIPGIKTTSLLSRFDSVQGWENISRSVRDALEYADENEIVLENETAFLRVRRGEETVNLDDLRQGLEALPNGIKVIWYPGIAGTSEAMMKRYEDVCKVAVDVLDARFVDFSIDGHKAQTNPWRTTAQELLDALSAQPTIPILYCYGDDRWWRDEQLADVLDSVTKDRAILYPGFARWPQAAREISRLLADES